MVRQKIREFIYKRYNISFSKSGDDIQLYQLLKPRNPGCYVDIGCWHPFKASNTYYFYLRNWKGICIDPNPDLNELYNTFRPTDIFINSGISETTNTLEYFRFAESSMNTFSKEFIDTHKLGDKVKDTINVPLQPLSEILKTHLKENDRLDFFDIDVEGLDLEVLKSNDWQLYRPRFILIETNLSLQQELTSEVCLFLEEKGYRLQAKSVIEGNLGNLIFIEK